MSEEQRAEEDRRDDPATASPYETSGPDFEISDDLGGASEAQPGPSYSPSPVLDETSAQQVREAPHPQPASPTVQPTSDYHVDQARLQQYSMQPYAGQPGYGQQGYAGQGYGAYGYAPYTMGPQAEHPRAQTVLILGILGFLFWIPAFFGWYMGGKAKKEIQAGAPYRFDGSLKAGYILSIISSIIAISVTALYTLLILLIIVLALA